MKPVIAGYYSTKFGELWKKSLYDLIADTIAGIEQECQIERAQIDTVFIGNMLSGIAGGSLLLEAFVAQEIGRQIPVYRVEAACASGGMAFQMATMYLTAQSDKTVLVIGVEKMTDVTAEYITQALAAAASEEEQYVGLTFPGVYALLAQRYLHINGYTEEHLASISVKNHAHGMLNEKAHFRKSIEIDDVLQSPYIAFPLKVLDSSPISDGGAALLMTNKSDLIKKQKIVSILATETASDTASLARRSTLDGLPATQVAGQKAFEAAGISKKDIHIMEVHDCFSIAEILALEDLGFWKRGQGGAQAKEMQTHRQSGNNLIVNTSGGLKSAGHPVGGTGIKQLGEIYLQLTQQAGSRQVDGVHCGLAHNVGGSGGVAVVSILSS